MKGEIIISISAETIEKIKNLSEDNQKTIVSLVDRLSVTPLEVLERFRNIGIKKPMEISEMQSFVCDIRNRQCFLCAKRMWEEGYVVFQVEWKKEIAALVTYLQLKTIDKDIAIFTEHNLELYRDQSCKQVKNELEFVQEVLAWCGIYARERQMTRGEYLEHMQEYLEKVKTMSAEECREILIRTGVLDEYGNQKEQICNGGMLE